MTLDRMDMIPEKSASFKLLWPYAYCPTGVDSVDSMTRSMLSPPMILLAIWRTSDTVDGSKFNLLESIESAESSSLESMPSNDIPLTIYVSLLVAEFISGFCLGVVAACCFASLRIGVFMT